MKATSTLTSKGQITIPKNIRHRMGFSKGDQLEVRIQGSGVFLKPTHRISRMRLHQGSLAKYDDGRPIEEIIEEAKRLAAIEIVEGKKH